MIDLFLVFSSSEGYVSHNPPFNLLGFMQMTTFQLPLFKRFWLCLQRIFATPSPPIFEWKTTFLIPFPHEAKGDTLFSPVPFYFMSQLDLLSHSAAERSPLVAFTPPTT